ncbi:MAG TPA: carbohydrate ABC transporter permease [Candidatus Dormibacteraeota bacterium]|nr:carbohydrate ABC transporter permease [Candidatus Dormibacteraeota bacterium]
MSEVSIAKAAVAEAPLPDENETRRRIGRFVVYAILLLYSLVVFVPFLWTISTSFKTLPESLEMTLIPQAPTVAGYVTAWTQLKPALPVMFFNSFLLAAIVTATNVFFGALGGYAFARLRFPGREVLFILVLGTLMIPDQLRMVPVYQLLVNLGLVTPGPQNYIGISLIMAISATSLFIMRQFFLTIPFDLEESARIDGAGFFVTFRRILFPLSRPALAIVAIQSFQGTWNGFFWPLILLQAQSHWTLPLGLSQFRFQYSTNWPPLMALVVVATIPIVILYLFFQRYFVSGLSSGAVKG